MRCGKWGSEILQQATGLTNIGIEIHCYINHKGNSLPIVVSEEAHQVGL